MDPLREIAAERRIPLIEDNAQAIGAKLQGPPNWFRLATSRCNSFYPTKKSRRGPAGWRQ